MMVLKALKHAFHILVSYPVCWITGLYAGLIAGILLILEFTGMSFIAGKLFILAALISPFFVAGINRCLCDKVYTLGHLARSGSRYYFSVLLPAVMIFGCVTLLMSVVTAVAGLFGRSSPGLAGGAILGAILVVMITTQFFDIAAVCEEKRIFQSIKRSIVKVSTHAQGTIGFCFLCALYVGMLGIFGAMLWGFVLSDKFAPYLTMNMTQQREVFSTFSISDWQNLIGQEGVIITAVIFGIFALFSVPVLLVYRFTWYQEMMDQNQNQVTLGEFDEKGRWYKY